MYIAVLTTTNICFIVGGSHLSCMEYSPALPSESMANVGEYSLHGAYGFCCYLTLFKLTRGAKKTPKMAMQIQHSVDSNFLVLIPAYLHILACERRNFQREHFDLEHPCETCLYALRVY